MRILAALLLSAIPIATQPALPPNILILDFRPQHVSRILARIEGWGLRRSRVRALRNPCALTFAGQRHGHRGADGYAAFPTEEAGWLACQADLRAKYKGGMSTRAIVRLWSAEPDRYERLFYRIWNEERTP